MDQIAFPIPVRARDSLNAILRNSGILLIGVTGGIASGKSTVANMLKEMGAVIIDFDLLARQVVEPGKPAWKKITGYFGKEILEDDGDIDRRKLSNIVFKDPDKRSWLEGLTHPPIAEEFVRQVEKAASEDTGAIIQAVVPLLIEVGMQDLFHKVVVVHTSEETQIIRLMKRDGIGREESINILTAQMPIDDKIGYADLVIHNENSPEETKRQVEELWKTLREMQKGGL
ncbi:dephospho-CoA kinase [Thermodesulfobacteriota bacterium]